MAERDGLSGSGSEEGACWQTSSIVLVRRRPHPRSPWRAGRVASMPGRDRIREKSAPDC
jgi:hypothetical protein